MSEDVSEDKNMFTNPLTFVNKISDGISTGTLISNHHFHWKIKYKPYTLSTLSSLS